MRYEHGKWKVWSRVRRLALQRRKGRVGEGRNRFSRGPKLARGSLTVIQSPVINESLTQDDSSPDLANRARGHRVEANGRVYARLQAFSDTSIRQITRSPCSVNTRQQNLR